LNEDKLRIGVVGLGKMGLLHSSILNILPEVQLAGVCEKSAVTRKLFKKVLRDVPLVEDVTDFSDLDLDAVYITTPIPSHFTVAKTVYQERIARHLFIEKTLAAKYSEAKTLCELVNINGGANMVGYLRRFMVTFTKAKELLSQNAIGEPASFEVNAFSSDFCGVSNNAQASIARGGVLRDLGSYAIDLALWFFGGLQIDSAKIEASTGSGAEDIVNFTARTSPREINGLFDISWCKEGYRMPEVNITVKGAKGNIEVNDDKVKLTNALGKESTWYRVTLNDAVAFWLGGPEYYREDAYFVDCIKSGLVAEPSFENAAKVDMLIENIQECAKKL